MIIIKEITAPHGLKEFIRFPHTLFKGNPYWVPPLNLDEMATLRWDKNPAFDYCEARYFMAYKDGKAAGRIAAIINHRANEKWQCKNVRFGWVDFIEDVEVARALFDEVEKWAVERKMEGIEGPLGFTDMDYEGMLIEGFDKLPTIVNIYNYPYYPKFLEELGYKGKEDWIQMKFNASQPVPEKMERLNKLILQRYNLRIAKFKNAKEVIPYGKKFFQTLNKAFVNLYGFVELTDREIDVYVKNYLSFIQPDLVCMVLDEQDEVVAFGVSMPSLSRAFQKAKGKLFPFGFIHILKALKKYDEIDLYLNGVHPDWQRKGVASIYYAEMNKAYIRLGIKTAISNPQLISNTDAVSMWDNYEHEPYLKRRCYFKVING
ncbi:MAG: hypothetical protein LBH32_06945 [Dysgonamonadaceae bacterium]|jgi:GNAT superfamily N-acetyltransferase|nr:hypothetical protein [Dysgonamonadaceae bacterium]